MKIRIGGSEGDPISDTTRENQNMRTLMDFQNIATYFPKWKSPEHEKTYLSFLKGETNEADLLKIVHTNGKVILGDCLIVTLKSMITGRRQGLSDFELLVNSAKELYWYLSPHVEKLRARSLHLPDTFKPLSSLNNPKRHGHKVSDINQEVLLSLVDAMNSQLEKSYVARPNFKLVQNLLSDTIEICVKYSDYLTQNKQIQADYRENDDEEPHYKKALFQLPSLESFTTHKVDHERNAIKSLTEILEDKDFYEPVCVDIHFPERRSYRYVFVRNLKKFGFLFPISCCLRNIMKVAMVIGTSCGVKTLIQKII